MSLGKNNKLKIRIDIILATLIISVMFLFNYIRYITNYNMGLKSQFTISHKIFINIMLLCFITALIVIVIYIYRLCIHLKILNMLNRKDIYIRIFFTFLLIPLIFVGELYYLKNSENYLLMGFTEKLHREADIPAIQSWLETVDTYSLEFKQNYAKIKESEWPDFIVKLSPKDVYFERYNKDKTRARLLWGGTLVGRWGLVVGNKAMTMPIIEARSDDDDDYRIQFAPGAYIWYDD